MVSKINEKNGHQKSLTARDFYLESQQHKIALAAYYKAERRGFEPGHELDDWLEAEHDVMGTP